MGPESESPTDRRPAPRPHRTPLRTALAVLGAGVAAGALIVAAATIVLVPLASAEQRAHRVSGEDLALQRQTSALRVTLVRWQNFVEPKFDAYQLGASFGP